MANNVIQIKRTSVSGRAANSTTLTNVGELGINITDGIMYSTNGTVVFAIGANNVNVNITGNASIKAINANGSLGSAGQVLTTNGSVVYWSTVSGGGGSSTPLPKSIFVESPVSADKFVMFYTNSAITLSEVRSVLIGNSTPSATFSISYGSNVSATGTQVVTGGTTCTNVTTGLATTSFNNGTISANSFVWLSVNAVSGNVTSLHVSMN